MLFRLKIVFNFVNPINPADVLVQPFWQQTANERIGNVFSLTMASTMNINFNVISDSSMWGPTRTDSGAGTVVTLTGECFQHLYVSLHTVYLWMSGGFK